MVDNLAVGGFSLDDEDMAAIAGLDDQRRPDRARSEDVLGSHHRSH